MTRYYDGIEAAAEALGVSGKTVQRRLRAGKLTGHYDGHRWRIAIPDEVVEAVTESEASGQSRAKGGQSGQAVEVEALRAELEAVKSERDYLRAHVADVTGQLRQTNTNLSAALYQLGALTERLALPAPGPGPGPVAERAAEHVEPEADRAPAASPADRGPWWRRLFGG